MSFKIKLIVGATLKFALQRNDAYGGIIAARMRGADEPAGHGKHEEGTDVNMDLQRLLLLLQSSLLH